jgi:hypothetical protein
MRILIVLSVMVILMAGCAENHAEKTAQIFCDTTCTTDTFDFEGKHKLKPYVSISVNNCLADTLTWSHTAMNTSRQMHMATLLNSPVRLNKSAINCYFKDTSYAWLSFNDCVTGRGYLMQLPYSREQTIRKMTSAINSFDKKFAIADDLRAYADYSTIYVEDINTGKKEKMTFKEEYKINWNRIHEVIDSVNVSHNRIFVQLIKDGQKVPLEKNISL